MSLRTADVVVAGGGPAGAIAAREAALGGARVLLIDDVDARARKIGESLPAAARPLCRHLGLESLLERSDHLLSFGNASAWGEDRLHTVDFIRDRNGLGWHLDRALFDQSLREAAMAAGVEWIRQRIARVERADGLIRSYGDGVEITSRWVIDATGRRARVATRLGATVTRDDGLVALCTWIRPAGPDPDMRSLIEAGPGGWWYSAKVPGGERVLGYFTDRDRVQTMARDPEIFRAAALRTKHVRAHALGATFLCEPRGFAASGAVLNRCYGQGWVATGDAAMAFDPVSSQGIFHALYTGMKSGRAVVAALGGNLDLMAEYGKELARVRTAYLLHHRQAYAREQRYSNQMFWQERQSEAQVLHSATLPLVAR